MQQYIWLNRERNQKEEDAVAVAPNKTSCGNNSHTEGITMYQFPTDPVVRAQWVRFVQKHRVDFGEPVNKYASLCSAHFEESCFTRNRSILEGMAASNVRRVLIKGSVPTRDTVLPPSAEEFLTERNKRKVKFKLLLSLSRSFAFCCIRHSIMKSVTLQLFP